MPRRVRAKSEVTVLLIFFVVVIVISHDGVQTVPLIKEVLCELAVLLVAFLLKQVKHLDIVTHIRVALFIFITACHYYFFFFRVHLFIVLNFLFLGFAATT
jgi:hypothetical protein